jgi:dGTPase
MAAMDLAALAMDASRSRGRRWAEPAHPYRGEYARDRDRVIHSRAFRRLEAKTQVFTTRYSDHFRNRLTHTIEVAQVARTVAQALSLNTDLAEALALVHDIGHPPFGHAGEARLNELMGEYGDRFDHNLHALRIVEQFEQRYLDFPGLNLTFEVREGIVKHSRDYSLPYPSELAEYKLELRPPIEAQLMNAVDEIAYNSADLDDGFEAQLLRIDMLREEFPFFTEVYDEIDGHYPDARTKLKIGETIKRILDLLATDLIEQTRQQASVSAAKDTDVIRRLPQRVVGFSARVAKINADLKAFLYRHLYDHPAIVEDRDRSVDALEQVFRYYVAHPEAMPKYYCELAKQQSRHRVACDYIAGMTDHFLLRQHHELIGVSASI